MIPGLNKDDPRLPDFYTVTFHPITGGKPQPYEVASHVFVKTPTKYILKGEELIPVEWQPLRAVELMLTDRRRILIGMELGTLEFSEEFDKIVALKESRDKKTKAQN
jgi:hypothetical protein